MLPKDKGGVVDHTLKVYGTTNLRVVDLSVVPLHIGTHTQCKGHLRMSVPFTNPRERILRSYCVWCRSAG